MNTKAISERLVELLRKKEFIKAQQELFHTSAVNIEPGFHPKPETRGLSNILKKEETFLAGIKKWYQFEVSDPMVSQDHFCVRMFSRLSIQNDLIIEVDELIIYQTGHGKIVSEQFFYSQPQ